MIPLAQEYEKANAIILKLRKSRGFALSRRQKDTLLETLEHMIFGVPEPHGGYALEILDILNDR